VDPTGPGAGQPAPDGAYLPVPPFGPGSGSPEEAALTLRTAHLAVHHRSLPAPAAPHDRLSVTGHDPAAAGIDQGTPPRRILRALRLLPPLLPVHSANPTGAATGPTTPIAAAKSFPP
jgi:hypothetical protein